MRDLARNVIVRINPVVILILALAIFVWAPLTAPHYFMNAHDARHSIFFPVEFDRAFRDGAWYPRWAVDQAVGYGYPTFNLYAPLSLYIVEFFHLLGAGFTAAVKLTFAFGLIASGFTMYALVRRLFGRAAGVIAAVTYIYMPYHLVDVYVRADLAESLAFVFPPLILLFVYELVETGRPCYVAYAALSYAALILTHNVTGVMIFTPLLTICALFLLGRRWYQAAPRSARVIVVPIGQLALVALLAISAAAIHLVPMVVEKQYVNETQWTREGYGYERQFVYPRQFFTPNWGYGYAVDGPDDEMSLQLGLAGVAGAIVSFLLLWRRETPHRDIIGFYLVATVGIAFMMTAYSTPLWRIIPIVALIQFPWRLLLLTSLTLSVLTGAAFAGLFRSATVAAPSTIFAIMTVVIASYPYTAPEYTPFDSRSETPAATIQFEVDYPDMRGMTIWTREFPHESPLVEQYLAGEPLTKAHVLRGEAELEMLHHGGHSEVVRVNAVTDATIQFYTYYYPGWRGYVDGQEVPIRPEGRYGLIALDVPAGEHRVSIKMGSTPPRTLGTVLTALSLGGMLLWSINRWGFMRWRD